MRMNEALGGICEAAAFWCGMRAGRPTGPVRSGNDDVTRLAMAAAGGPPVTHTRPDKQRQHFLICCSRRWRQRRGRCNVGRSRFTEAHAQWLIGRLLGLFAFARLPFHPSALAFFHLLPMRRLFRRRDAARVCTSRPGGPSESVAGDWSLTA
jgi:hypothetical protein